MNNVKKKSRVKKTSPTGSNDNSSASVTKQEFAEGMQIIATSFAKMATKDDLALVERRLGTLETGVNTLETKFDTLETKVDTLETKFDTLETKFDTLEMKLDDVADNVKGILDHVDAAVENRQIELGAAKTEHVQMIGEKVDRQEQRIAAVEHRIGIPPA